MSYSTIKKQYQFKKKEIQKKINEFHNISEDKYFQELLFCLLTPQSNAKKCWQAVEEISQLTNLNQSSVKKILKSKTRFHNNKTRYILEAKNQENEIKKQIKNNKSNPIKLRDWLINNIKGLGQKEASHFLRNIGLSNNKIAILDRHILKNLYNLNIIQKPTIKNKKDYLEKEQEFIKFSQKTGIPIDNLDLFFWSNENGEIFK